MRFDHPSVAPPRRRLAAAAFLLSLALTAGPGAMTAAAQVQRSDSLAVRRSALAAAEARGDSSAIASAAEELGLEHWRADRFDSAIVHLVHSREILAARRDSVAQARVLNALGSSHYQLGNYELALQAYVQALDLRARAGNVLGQAYLYTNIGLAYQDWRQYDRAVASLDSAIALAERAGDGHALGYALNTKAAVLVKLRRFDEARALVERSLAAYYSGAPPLSPRDSASAWSINRMLLGEADLAEGRSEDALRRFTDIYERARRGNTRRGQAHSLLGIARAQEAAGRSAQAAQAFAQALRDAEAIGHRAYRLEALAGLSRVEERRGNIAAALRALRAYDALRDSVFDARTAQRVAALQLEAEAERQREATAALALTQRRQAEALRQQRLLTGLAAALLLLTLTFVFALLRANREVREREAQLAARNRELQDALAEVKTLSGFIPICANCKNVRDDAGYWQSVEAYIASRSAAQVSHSICNTCGPKLYGDAWEPPQPPVERAGSAGQGDAPRARD